MSCPEIDFSKNESSLAPPSFSALAAPKLVLSVRVGVPDPLCSLAVCVQRWRRCSRRSALSVTPTRYRTPARPQSCCALRTSKWPRPCGRSCPPTLRRMRTSRSHSVGGGLCGHSCLTHATHVTRWEVGCAVTHASLMSLGGRWAVCSGMLSTPAC